MTKKQKEKFLKAIAIAPVVAVGCRLAGVSRLDAYREKEDDPDFSGAWDEALEDAVDALELEGLMRAMNGSDSLLVFMLRASRPERFNPETQEKAARRIEELLDRTRR